MNVEKLEKFVKKQMMKNIANYEAEFNNIVDAFQRWLHIKMLHNMLLINVQRA